MDRAALDAMVSAISATGERELEEVFQELRDRGISPIQSIYVVSRVFGLTLPEAKTAIYASSAWRDQHANWEQLNSVLIGDRDQPSSE